MSALSTHPARPRAHVVDAAVDGLHEAAGRGHDVLERVRTAPLPEPVGIAGRARRAAWVALSSAALGGGALLVTGLLAGVVDAVS